MVLGAARTWYIHVEMWEANFWEMNHSSLFGLATIIGGEKCFKKESSNFIFNVPNLNESSPRGGSKTEVPTLFDGNGLFETRKRVP